MVDRHILYKLKPFIENAKIADAEDIAVDGSSLANLASVSDSQDVANELNRLFGIVSNIQTPRQMKALVTFDSAVTVTSGNFADYQNRNAVYVATADQRINFLLPLESAIPSGQYPVTFEITNLGGTKRFDTGAAPTNTVVVDTQSSDTTNIERPSGTDIAFGEVHQGDVAVITKAAAGQDWVFRKTATDPRTSLLPNGIFNLRPELVSGSSGNLVGFGLTSIVQGYAYEISTDIPTFGSGGLRAGDVIVAKEDNPSRVISSANEDWLVIRDLQNFPLTISEIRLLAQWTESTRNVAGNQLTNSRFWLLDSVPTTAPLLSLAQNDAYTATSTQVDKFLLVALPVNQSTDLKNLIFRTTNEAGETEDISFMGNFVEKTDIGIISQRRYFLLGTSLTAGSRFLLPLGAKIEARAATQARLYTPSSSVDVTSSVNNVQMDALNANLQTRIAHGLPLGAPEVAMLNGFTVSSELQTFDSSSTFFAIYGDIAPDLANGTLTNGNRFPPNFQQTNLQILVPQGSNISSFRKISATSTTLPLTYLGDLDLGFNVVLSHYSTTLPAAPAGQTLDSNAYEIVGNYNQYTLNGANTSFKLNRGNISDSLNAYIEGLSSGVPQNLTQFSSDLTAHASTTSTWDAILPSPYRATLTQQFAALWDENRATFTGNYFTNRTGVEVFGFNNGSSFYYVDGNDPSNRLFAGNRSYVYEDNIRFRNLTGQSTISTSFRKVIAFEYTVENQLTSSSNYDMLRIGPAGTTALMGLSEQEGLYLNIGRGDGGTQTRTVQDFFQVDNSQWQTRVGVTLNEEAEIIIPNNLTGSQTVTIEIHGYNNDNDGGIQTFNYVINNVDADQNASSHTFSGFANSVSSLPVSIEYDHDNNDLSVTRRVITLSSTLNNGALHYNIRAYRSVSSTWNAPSTYARQGINAGSAFDDHGFYDPTRQTTESVHARNKVILSIQKANENDTSANPELAVLVEVDGELENNGQPISLGRHTGDFTFNDINFGNAVSAISKVQCYDYAGTPFNAAEIQKAYGSLDNWLGAFNPPGRKADRYDLDADLEFTVGHGTITQSQNGKRWKLTFSDTGTPQSQEVT